MLPSVNARAGDRPSGDYLKLDNDISFSKSGLKVETILFDKSTGMARSKNLFTIIFGKVMEWRAKNWIQSYVEKNKDYLPGAEKFLKNINSSYGVKRSEVVSLLVAAKISRSPIFSMPELNTNGLKSNYLIKDSSENVINFFVNSMSPTPSHDGVKVFFDFIEKGSPSLNYENIQHSLNFLENFRQWSENNPGDNLVATVKGSVNLFRSSVIKKIQEFNHIDNFYTENEKQKIIQSTKIEKDIKDAFKAVLDAEKNSKFISNEILGKKGKSCVAVFLGYVRNGSSGINFSNTKELESWEKSEMQKFIDNLPWDYQYLIPSLEVVRNQLKIDISEFHGESFKVAIDRPDFLPTKISAHAVDDDWQ